MTAAGDRADRASDLLGELVEHLERRRAAGNPKWQTLREQAAHREGFTEALKFVQSGRFRLLVRDED